MNERNFGTFIMLRLFMSLLPLFFGWPLLAFCLCAQTVVITVIASGPWIGSAVCAVTACAAAAVSALCGFGWTYGGFLALKIILAAVLCATAVIARRSFSVGLMGGAVSYGIGEMLNISSAAGKAGLSGAEYISSSLVQPMLDALYAQAGAADESLNGIRTLLETVGGIVKTCAPAALAVESAAAGYILMWLVSKALRKSPLDNGHSFAEIRISPAAVIFGAVMLVMVFVPNEAARVIGTNGFLVFVALAACAGLSLTDFFLRQKVEPVLPRILIHCVIIFFGMVISVFMPVLNIFLLYALIGMADSFASIRKRVNLGNEEQ